MEEAVNTPDRAIDEPADETRTRTSWRDHLIMLLGAGLDAVRVATAALAAYQLARMMGAPGIEHESLLNALSIWHLVGIYLTSAVLTFLLGRARRHRSVRATLGGPDQDASDAEAEDPRPIAQ